MSQKGAIMPEQDGHDVRYDYAGFSNDPRLTCVSCGGATLAGQPWMTQSIFDAKVAEFIKQHPPENDLVTDADRRGEPMTVQQLLGE